MVRGIVLRQSALGNGVRLRGLLFGGGQRILFEWSNRKAIQPAEDLEISIAGVFGWNEGYVEDGHKGLNHFALRLGSHHALKSGFSLVGHLVQSWAINRDSRYGGDQNLKDLFDFGIGLEYEFRISFHSKETVAIPF